MNKAFKTLKTHLLGILILVSIAGHTQGQAVVSKPRAGAPGTWRLLGTVTANFAADHDVIIVAGPYDYFRRLKFKVTHSPIYIDRMIVNYDDGGLPEKVDVRHNIPQGGESREIDLRGGKRKIKTVQFWYSSKGILSGKASVTLFGIK